MPDYKCIENFWNHPKLWADGSPVEGPKMTPQEWECIIMQRIPQQGKHETNEK